MRLRLVLIVISVCVLAGCAVTPPLADGRAPLPPIRFLLTFDDGPSPALDNDNPTARIADTLATNPTQPGIKAVFFVQTRAPIAGGSAVGKRLLQRLVADGHVLGVHSGTARGHINHRAMGTTELVASLTDGAADIQAISGEAAGLVRPPFWAFDQMTLAAYDQTGISMLLTDLRARDGVQWIFGLIQDDPDTGGKMRNDLVHFRQRLINGTVSTVDGVAPVVVTFHDLNRYTAKHLSTYLTTLIQMARDAGFDLAEPAF